MNAVLHSDGGARGNPGPAGIGFVLESEEGSMAAVGEYIGEATNNQAEYRALIAGMERARQEKVKSLTCFLDSELIVRQLNGQYRVKHAELKPLHQQVKKLQHLFEGVTFQHVPREKNTQADRLVNEAIDTYLSANHEN